jgi:hypothetical protein
MNTRTLVVGQKIWMQSGDQLKEATVTEITENYVRVEITRTESENGYCIDFRYDGVQSGVWGWVDAWDPRPLCGEPLKPWKLVDSIR